VVATNDRVLQWLSPARKLPAPRILKARDRDHRCGGNCDFHAEANSYQDGLDGNKDVIYLDVGQGNQLSALLGGGFDAAVLSVEQRYVALDKGMHEMFFMGNE
jgi:hypothetical protein